MGAPRKNPPNDIGEIIERVVAGEGGSTKILARTIGVSDSLVRAWFDRDEELFEQYEMAREAHMHKLYLELMQMARSGKGNVAGIIFTLKARFKQYDMPGSGKLVDVNVAVERTNVMVVTNFGKDNQEWAAAAAAQQRALIADIAATHSGPDESQPKQIEASLSPSEPIAYPAPSWGASDALEVPVPPQYGPPSWVKRC